MNLERSSARAEFVTLRGRITRVWPHSKPGEVWVEGDNGVACFSMDEARQPKPGDQIEITMQRRSGRIEEVVLRGSEGWRP